MELNLDNLESLQAYAYRLIVNIENIQIELRKVNELINNRSEVVVEKTPTKEK
jgi:hypothetical protein